MRYPIRAWVGAISVCLLAFDFAIGAERLRVATGNSDEIAIRDCLKAAAQAVTDEDLESYVLCFRQERHKAVRREAGLLFVSYDCSLELLEAQLLAHENDSADWAVRYRFTLSRDSYEVVSTIGMVKENEQWRIGKEKVLITTRVRSGGESDDRPEQAVDFGGGGLVILNPRGDDFLPRDIAKRPGGGCANGQCGIR